MTAAAIEKIVSLAPSKTFMLNGVDYIDTPGRGTSLANPPLPDTLTVHTLQGFVAALESLPGSDTFAFERCAIVVDSTSCVQLVNLMSNSYGQRALWAKAEYLKPERAFPFNTYLPQEEFNIAIRSMFVQDENTAEVSKLAGNLAANKEIAQEDDGFSQRVNVKAGVVRVETKYPSSRVALRPYRTFTEVEQPASEFVLRIRNDENRGNMLALFEADGGDWKRRAMHEIAQWLKRHIGGSTAELVKALPILH
jgi:hypothetical protein